MDLATNIRRGSGPFWGTLKLVAGAVLTAHLPVNAVTRPVFSVLYALHVAVRESWIATKRFWWCEPLFRSQCASVGKRFRMEELPYLVGGGKIHIGDDVRFSGKPGITFTNRAFTKPVLRIGNSTYFGHRVRLSIAKTISIGDHCLIAGAVTIRDYDGHSLDWAARRAGDFVLEEDIKPVTIGNDVWIGMGAQVLKGVSIGDRSVVASGAVVVDDVPCDVVVAGCPARIVKRLALGEQHATARH